MITQYLKAPPFKYITSVVCAQLAIVCGLAVITLLLLIYRNWSKLRSEQQKMIFADHLITELIISAEPEVASQLVVKPKWYQFAQRQSLQNVLLENLTSVTGPEKAFLTRRYIELGFSQKDVRASRSFFWWRRLLALSHLALLSTDTFASTFHRLTTDRNELISAFAYIPLSELNHELNLVQPIEQLPAAVLKRKNVVHEVLKNWCRVYGHQVLVEQIDKIREPNLITPVIHALAMVPTPEIAEVFTHALRDLFLNVESIEHILILLKNVGDPASASAVEPYLNHSSEVIRLNALEYFIAIGDTEVLAASTIYSDQSILIRRVLQKQNLRQAS